MDNVTEWRTMATKLPLPNADARRFIDLLRGGDQARLGELRGLTTRLMIDTNLLLALAVDVAPDEAARRATNRALRAKSKAARSAAADDRASKVRMVIDDIRRREGDVGTTVLANRLNELRIPAPRGGTWSGAQVQRVLARTAPATDIA